MRRGVQNNAPLDGAVEALADPVGLRMPSFGAGVIDILHRQVQLILVVLALTTVFCAAISEHTQERNFLFLEERQHTIVEHVGGDERVLAVVQLGEGDLGVRVEECLLIDAPHAFDGSHVIGILGDQLARMRGFDFAVSFLFFARPLHGAQLLLGENDVILGRLGFQRFEPLAECFQIVPQPDATHASRGNEETAFRQLVRRPHLAQSPASPTPFPRPLFRRVLRLGFLGQGLR